MTDTDSSKTGMFEEEPGQTSSMRVMCFISLLAAIGAAYMEIKAGVPFPYTTTMFLGGAFGGKTAQKFAERK